MRYTATIFLVFRLFAIRPSYLHLNFLRTAFVSEADATTILSGTVLVACCYNQVFPLCNYVQVFQSAWVFRFFELVLVLLPAAVPVANYYYYFVQVLLHEVTLSADYHYYFVQVWLHEVVLSADYHYCFVQVSLPAAIRVEYYYYCFVQFCSRGAIHFFQALFLHSHFQMLCQAALRKAALDYKYVNFYPCHYQL